MLVRNGKMKRQMESKSASMNSAGLTNEPKTCFSSPGTTHSPEVLNPCVLRRKYVELLHAENKYTPVAVLFQFVASLEAVVSLLAHFNWLHERPGPTGTSFQTHQ